MKALENAVKAIYELGISKEVIEFFQNSKSFIIEAWSHSEVTNDIIASLNIKREEFILQVAEPVYEYFTDILLHHHNVGECPAMSALVKKFQTLGLRVEDVFMNCTAFKNIIVRVFDERSFAHMLDDKHKLLMILDYNLYGVLRIYSGIIESLNMDVEERKKIIDENVALSRTDTQGNIIEVTDAFCAMSGYTKEELIGQKHSMLKHPDVEESLYVELWATIQKGEIWRGEMPNLRKDGSTFISAIKIIPIKEKNDEIKEYLAVRHDITADHMAFHDVLTGLYNRRAFDTKYIILFEQAKKLQEPLCIVMVDIDQFKLINDTYGHLVGDEVIKAISNQLVQNTRSHDLCARWGGEEFVIVLPDTQLPQAMEICERIREQIEKYVQTPNSNVTCSFGLAQRENGESAKKLLERADESLYRAKQNGRNRCER